MPDRRAPGEPDPDDGSEPGGSRTIEVPMRRLERWLDGFAQRHGQVLCSSIEEPRGWALRAADGSMARVHAPAWLGLLGPMGPPGLAGDGGDDADALDPLRQVARTRPRYGVLVIRRAGYAVAAFDGERMVDRKIGSRHIHGRTAAGGWSQQRYARRRGNQADEIAGAAAVAANRILGTAGCLFLATGGDRPLLGAVREKSDPAVKALPVVMHLAVGTPDPAVVAGFPDRILSVRIDLVAD